MKPDVRKEEDANSQINDLLELREQTIILQKEAMNVFGNLYRRINQQIINSLDHDTSKRYNESHKVIRMP